MNKTSKFSHLDSDGKARMVDVSKKVPTVRTAEAEGYITLDENIITKIKENGVKKGDVFSVAKIAGINAAKKTWELIPLCHQLALTGIDIGFTILDDENKVRVNSRVKTNYSTGVEMEALTAVSTSILTIYDMCKALSKSMQIGPIYLLSKTGGKSDYNK
ncbi:MAG: cyclic pyranopterin monophosphate synthase MoaC [Candidatus Humimicrobiaceae bacterium]